MPASNPNPLNRLLLGIIAVFLLFSGDIAAAQPAATTAPPSQEARRSETDSPTLRTLTTLTKSIEARKGQQKALKQELKSAHTEEQKVKITSAINRLDQSLEALESDFERISTGVDMDAFDAQPQQGFDWKEEVQDLLGPIIQELKSMTARPRQIEKLRSEVAYYENRIRVVEKAIVNLRKLSEQTKDAALKGQLERLQKNWESQRQQISSQLTIATYQLDEKTREKKSLWDSTQNILKIFFKSRGRNLFFAVTAFVLVFLILRSLHRVVYKFSPALKSKERSFYLRLGEVIYQIMTFVGAVSVALIVLYGSGDWVLLSIAIIFIIGLAWTAKQGLPRFWEQIKLLLNLGTVRENERLIYNGLPWKVMSVNLYSHLENPALKGSRIRLPLRDLVNHNSRPYQADEPWFPCKENDWVILADGTQGKVITQTPDIVRLVLRGGSRKTYLTEEFLRQNPNNISTNFRLKVTFGVDYAHQAISTTEVPAKMKEMLEEELTGEGHGKHLINLKVEFKAAGASSLDMEIIADFSGSAAQNHNVLARAMQRIAVDACNRNGWVIPFTQITVHNSVAPAES